MAATTKINGNGGPCKWGISVSHLKLGVYRATLFDANNIVLEVWQNQRTDDSIPDTFDIKTDSGKLIGAILWWECVVSDPGDQGGPCVCTITIYQNGQVVCQEPVSQQIPAGNGKIEYVGDQIKFVAA